MSPAFRTDGAFGFYPIVPSADEVGALLRLGARTVQLRAKSVAPAALHAEIEAATAHGAAHDAQVVINDHWRLALDLGARWVHLGQEDLDTADLGAIRRAGIGLGISSHTPGERDRALDAGAAYIALGPVFETTLKAMRFAPQGLKRLAQWKAHLGAVPLVAIGGLRLEHAQGLRRAGADSVAMVSDVQGEGRRERVAAWIDAMSAPVARDPLPEPDATPRTALYALRRHPGGAAEAALRARLATGQAAILGAAGAGLTIEQARVDGTTVWLDGVPHTVVRWQPGLPPAAGALLYVHTAPSEPEARHLCAQAARAGASLVIPQDAALLARIAANHDVAAVMGS